MRELVRSRCYDKQLRAIAWDWAKNDIKSLLKREPKTVDARIFIVMWEMRNNYKPILR